MRRNAELSGSQVASPTANPLSTFQVRGAANNTAPVERHLADFSALSRVLQVAIDERKADNDQSRRLIGSQVADLREQGVAEEDILTRLSESGKTPRQALAFLAAQVQKGTIDEIDNPAFRLGLEGRRAESKVREYGRALAAQVEATAQAVSTAELGQEEATALKALGKFRADNEETLSTLGFFGSRAAEGPLLEEHNRFLDAVISRQRDLRREDYRSKAVQGIRELAASYVGAKTAGEKKLALEEISAEYDRAKLEGVQDPDAFFENAIRSTAAQIGIDSGYKEAAAFLEDALYSSTSGSGNKILLGSDSLAIIGDIARYESLAEEEEREKPAKIANAIRTAQSTLVVGDVGRALSDASRQGTEYVVSIAQDIRADLQENPEQFGVNPEDPDSLNIFLAALDDLEKDYLSAASGRGGILRESYTSQAVVAAIEGGIEGGLAYVRGLDLPAGVRAGLENAVRDTAGRENERVAQAINATGLKADLFATIHAQRYPFSEQLSISQKREVDELSTELYADFINQTILRNRDQEVNAKYTSVTAFTDAGAFLDKVKEGFATAETGVPKTDAKIKEINQKAKLERQSDSVTQLLGGNKNILINGNLKDEDTPEALVRATDFAAKPPTGHHTAVPTFGTIRNSLLGRSTSYFDTETAFLWDKPEGVPQPEWDTTIAQTLLSSGQFSLRDAAKFIGGFPEEIDIFTVKEGEERAPSKSTDWANSAPIIVPSKINPFTTRLKEFENAKDWITYDRNTEAAILKPGALKGAGKDGEFMMRYILERTGNQADDTTILRFLAAQASMWGKPLN